MPASDLEKVKKYLKKAQGNVLTVGMLSEAYDDIGAALAELEREEEKEELPINIMFNSRISKLEAEVAEIKADRADQAEL